MTDAAKLPLMLAELRMPTIGRLWQDVGERADREGWGAAHFLAALCEHELAERATRRIARHLAEAGLPPGKTLVRVNRAVRKGAVHDPALRPAQRRGQLGRGRAYPDLTLAGVRLATLSCWGKDWL